MSVLRNLAWIQNDLSLTMTDAFASDASIWNARARLESLPCAADFLAAHFKFQLRFQPRNFRKTTEGNNRTIV